MYNSHSLWVLLRVHPQPGFTAEVTECPLQTALATDPSSVSPASVDVIFLLLSGPTNWLVHPVPCCSAAFIIWFYQRPPQYLGKFQVLFSYSSILGMTTLCSAVRCTYLVGRQTSFDVRDEISISHPWYSCPPVSVSSSVWNMID